jgi:hypothetical protein
VARRFWDLTPEELLIEVECWNRQQAREMDRLALLVCLLRPAVWSKKRLKPKDILGRSLMSEQRKRKRLRAAAETTED